MENKNNMVVGCQFLCCGDACGFDALLLLFESYKIRQKNEIIKNGELIWCRIDKMKSKKNMAGLVVWASYFWKDTQQFISYYESISFGFSSKNEKYEEQLWKESFMPIFVERIDRNKYAIALWNIQYTQEEIYSMNLQDKVIRVIDRYTV